MQKDTLYLYLFCFVNKYLSLVMLSYISEGYNAQIHFQHKTMSVSRLVSQGTQIRQEHLRNIKKTCSGFYWKRFFIAPWNIIKA